MDSKTYLDDIIRVKKERLAGSLADRANENIRALSTEARQSAMHHAFRAAIDNDSRVNIIAEFKRASPSKGEIKAGATASETALRYQRGGAAAISVLTEEDFFHGSLDDLSEVKRSCSLPVLRKDFVFDSAQIYEAALAGADAVLLIVAALDDETLVRLRTLVEDDLGMDALVEVHTAEEMSRADAAGSKLIGVNNRDLRTFDVSLDVSVSLARIAPQDALLVSESGITGPASVQLLMSHGYRAFLVGEHLMRADRPEDELKRLISVRA